MPDLGSEVPTEEYYDWWWTPMKTGSQWHVWVILA